MSDGTKKGLIIVVAVAMVGYAAYAYWNNFAEPAIPADTRTMMDAETGKLFYVKLDENFGPYPHLNPDTGQRTLWPTEVCFARQCGEKENGTHVILNNFLGKEGPTTCPECGALVVSHNPGRVKKQSDETQEDDTQDD